MPCHTVALPGGGHAIVRMAARSKCSVCRMRPHTKLCDGPARTKSGTCDRKLCDACALTVAPNKDLCPDCQVHGLGPEAR